MSEHDRGGVLATFASVRDTRPHLPLNAMTSKRIADGVNEVRAKDRRGGKIEKARRQMTSNTARGRVGSV